MKLSVFVTVFALSSISLSYAACIPTLAMKATYRSKSVEDNLTTYDGVLDINTLGILECSIWYDKNSKKYVGQMINIDYDPKKWRSEELPENEAEQHYLEMLAQDPELKK